MGGGRRMGNRSRTLTFGKLSIVLDAEGILPEQMLTTKHLPAYGDRKLRAAVLRLAVLDLMSPHAKLRQSATRWFITVRSRWPASFRNVCQALDLEETSVLRALRQRGLLKDAAEEKRRLFLLQSRRVWGYSGTQLRVAEIEMGGARGQRDGGAAKALTAAYTQPVPSPSTAILVSTWPTVSCRHETGSRILRFRGSRDGVQVACSDCHRLYQYRKPVAGAESKVSDAGGRTHF